MTTPSPATPTPSAAAPTGPDVAAVDQALAERARTSADVLAGILAAGMLDKVGRPQLLPELLFPDADPALVRAIWEAALPIGYWAGKQVSRTRWDTADLDRLRKALRDAGFERMAAAADRAAYAAPSRPAEHPADTDAWTVRERP